MPMEYVFYVFVVAAIATLLFGMIIAKSPSVKGWMGVINTYTEEVLFLSSAGTVTVCWAIFLGYGIINGIQWLFCGLYNIFF